MSNELEIQKLKLKNQALVERLGQMEDQLAETRAEYTILAIQMQNSQDEEVPDSEVYEGELVD